MSFTVALSGDAIVNKRFSNCEDQRFLELIELFRGADVGFTHLETVIHDYDGPEVYPAAEAAGTWMRSPRGIADDLGWGGFDLVSHASNHALDYGYGALRQTWATLNQGGIAHAGTGETLGDARSPAYVETNNGRVALVSMTSSFPRWARAGDARSDVKGRPGVNFIRHHHEVDEATAGSICTLAEQLGWWLTREEDQIIVHKPGVHNSIDRFVVSEDVDGARLALNATDKEKNWRAIEDAARQADLTITHVHSHESEPGEELTVPPRCLRDYARECIDAGADVVVFQGSHAPLRGIELYRDRPIFYDPGDFFFQSDSTSRLPADFYERYSGEGDIDPLAATPTEGFRARGLVYPWGKSNDETGSAHGGGEDLLHPPNGMFVGPGSVVPVCTFDDESNLERIEIHPAKWFSEPKSRMGMPRAVDDEEGNEILEYLRTLCEEYDTSYSIEDGVGILLP